MLCIEIDLQCALSDFIINACFKILEILVSKKVGKKLND